MGLKISVITPSFNSSHYIEKAICSVLDQDYTNYEHIVIDGGSTDQTLAILKKYSHLVWISEKDRGQVDAMNKGFRMATGDIIVYLNADDYFICGAFSSVIPCFNQGHKFVVGDIVVQKNNEYFINIPRTTIEGMLRHWEMNAFPYNPVGYFYSREVQETIPFDENFTCMMDLRFLLEAVTKFNFIKINALLGVYRCIGNTKTSADQNNLNYWTEENFWFINNYLPLMSHKYVQQFRKDRVKGYEQQQEWQKALLKKTEMELYGKE